MTPEAFEELQRKVSFLLLCEQERTQAEHRRMIRRANRASLLCWAVLTVVLGALIVGAGIVAVRGG